MYFKARADEDEETTLYRAYVTDALKIATENTARQVSEGQYLSRRWIEIINPNAEDARSGDEIAADVIRQMGLTIEGGE